MVKDNYNVIGIMSGTSLDGVDIAYLHFYKKANKWTFKILEATTYKYAKEWQEKLTEVFTYNETDVAKFNVKYTTFLGSQITQFIKSYSITEIDAVCSHGHTVFHKPDEGITVQIGNLSKLAEQLGITVVCDFRIQDVLLGGQGAPLVPLGDEFLFSDYDYCMNLGGFSNISFQKDGKRLAFDISPVNIVLNFYANKLNLAYDESGKIAQSGSINEVLLHQLNAISYYEKSYPKSLGKEFVSAEIFPLLNKYNLPVATILRTFTEHVVIQISRVIANNSSVLITGGGAYNAFLLKRLKELKPTIKWVVPNDNLIQFKEALIFGFLGILRLQNEINVLASVTGATHNHSSGKVYYPNSN